MGRVLDEDYYDVIVIGAGLYGLAFANTWLTVHPDARIKILEARPCLGGVWSVERVYDAFWTQTPLDMACFSNIPIDPPPTDQNHHGFFPAKYVTRYLETSVCGSVHQGKTLRQRILFSTPVQNVEKNDQGRWTVHHSNGQTLITSKLVVATGLTSEPNMPKLPGQKFFTGSIIHHKDFGSSSNLIDPKIMHVAVIGGAKSAADVAYASAKAGKIVSWIIRHSGSGPAALAPAEGMGPYKNSNELLYTRFAANLTPSIWNPRGPMEKLLHGTKIGRRIIDWVWRQLDMDARRKADYEGKDDGENGFGDLRPDTAMFWQNDSSGVVQRPDFWDTIAEKVKVYREDDVWIDNGSLVLAHETINPDVIVCATGWRPSYHSFINTSLAAELGLAVEASNGKDDPIVPSVDADADIAALTRFPRLGRPPMYHSSAAPSSPFRLYKNILPTTMTSSPIVFLGHIVVGNNFRAAEVQALWATAYLDGQLHVPSQARMEREVALQLAWCKRRYLGKGQLGHWLYYDLVPYTDQLLDEVGVKSHLEKGIWGFWKPCVAKDLKGIVAEYIDRRTLQGEKD
ncbi:monooxygenase [Lambiella insularis]|nr:monooxygenase [Lambiella insularis]